MTESAEVRPHHRPLEQARTQISDASYPARAPRSGVAGKTSRRVIVEDCCYD